MSPCERCASTRLSSPKWQGAKSKPVRALPASVLGSPTAVPPKLRIK